MRACLMDKHSGGDCLLKLVSKSMINIDTLETLRSGYRAHASGPWAADQDLNAVLILTLYVLLYKNSVKSWKLIRYTVKVPRWRVTGALRVKKCLQSKGYLDQNSLKAKQREYFLIKTISPTRQKLCTHAWKPVTLCLPSSLQPIPYLSNTWYFLL